MIIHILYYFLEITANINFILLKDINEKVNNLTIK